MKIKGKFICVGLFPAWCFGIDVKLNPKVNLEMLRDLSFWGLSEIKRDLSFWGIIRDKKTTRWLEEAWSLFVRGKAAPYLTGLPCLLDAAPYCPNHVMMNRMELCQSINQTMLLIFMIMILRTFMKTLMMRVCQCSLMSTDNETDQHNLQLGSARSQDHE